MTKQWVIAKDHGHKLTVIAKFATREEAVHEFRERRYIGPYYIDVLPNLDLANKRLFAGPLTRWWRRLA